LPSAHKEWEALSELGELIEPQSKNREDFMKECLDGKLDGVIAAYRTFDSVAVTGRFDEELCKVLPKSWKYLGICGMRRTCFHSDLFTLGRLSALSGTFAASARKADLRWSRS
jgi:hypothetical protein